MMQNFKVYEPARQKAEDAFPVEAADPLEAAKLFLERLPGADESTEVAVISDNGTESVFGFRQTVPQAHLDD